MGVSKRHIGILLFLIFLITAVISCKKELTEDEYKSFVSNPDNGLRKTEHIGDFELDVMYEPVNYLKSKNREVEEESNYGRFEHFQFRLKLKDSGNILLYNETQTHNEVTRINHFGFTAKDDFKIYTATDTFPCKLAHYSRNYNLSPTIDLTLAFDLIDKDSDWTLVYNDRQFNLGRTKFLFKKDDLTDLPELKL